MTWLREMASLMRQYYEAERAYRATLKKIKKLIKEEARK